MITMETKQYARINEMISDLRQSVYGVNTMLTELAEAMKDVEVHLYDPLAHSERVLDMTQKAMGADDGR